jgi:ribosome-interacting GTPase 1
MPANLTPEFLKARERLEKAQSPEEKLDCLEEMLAVIPKHKGTDHMCADIKRRIAKVKETVAQAKRSGRGGQSHQVDREGAGQVVLVGPPNSGKSSLLAALTNANPEVADYPFSTTVPVPGMMRHEDVQIQLVDLPPVTPELTEPWVYNLIRTSDLAVLVLDAGEPTRLLSCAEELMALLAERRIELVREADPSAATADARVRRLPCRIGVARSDLVEAPPNLDDLAALFPAIAVSALTEEGLDRFREEVFRALRVIRIYTKLPGRPPDLALPYTLPAGSTTLDAVKLVHRELALKLRYVRVWGSGRFDGQQVPSEHVLADKDIVEIHAG